ncbi:MAG: hypothetical protein UIM24_02590, partial [Clostridia bacterium]|nr:hypothetical protein [Clostridia bacterium]
MKNKKKIIYLVALLLISTVLFVGCKDNKKPEDQNVDYSQYSFVDTSWTRDAEHDTETIRFGEDGSFVSHFISPGFVNRQFEHLGGFI